jgi:acyl carrier protein
LQSSGERDALEQDIIDIILRETKLDRSLVTPDATLESLGLQSIDLVEAMMAIEEKFDVYFPMDFNLWDAKSVGQFVQTVASRIRSPGP